MSKTIRTITVDELENFGLDDEMQLYWTNKPIEIKKHISLTLWQKIGAIVTILSTASLATCDAVRFFQGR